MARYLRETYLGRVRALVFNMSALISGHVVAQGLSPFFSSGLLVYRFQPSEFFATDIVENGRFLC